MGFFDGLASAGAQAAGSYFGGPAGGQAAGALASMFGGGGGGSNPYNAGSAYLDRIPQMAKDTYHPFIGRGQQAQEQLPWKYQELESTFGGAFGNPNDIGEQYRGLESLYDTHPLNEQYSKMAQNPADFINSIQKSYMPSEGYNFKKAELLKTLRNSAAQGGRAGTSNTGREQAGLVQGLLSGDMQQYLQNILGAQGAGQAGQERLLSGRERGMTSRLGAVERQRENLAKARLASIGGLEKLTDRGANASDSLLQALMGNLGAQSAGAIGSQDWANRSGANQRYNEQSNAANLGQGLAGLFGGGNGGTPPFSPYGRGR